jgi:serine/threonine protein kinase
LGDFGLATRNRDADEAFTVNPQVIPDTDLSIYDAIDDIRPLLGDPALSVSKENNEMSTGVESMTGGVGTTFYRAPEQETGLVSPSTKKGDRRYTVHADIFSLGVILFEMFHPPFATYMERAETLTILRGDKGLGRTFSATNAESIELASGDEFVQKTLDRFPKTFRTSVPINAQR